MKKIFMILAVMALFASCTPRGHKDVEAVECADSTEVVAADSLGVAVDTTAVVAE